MKSETSANVPGRVLFSL